MRRLTFLILFHSVKLSPIYVAAFTSLDPFPSTLKNKKRHAFSSWGTEGLPTSNTVWQRFQYDVLSLKQSKNDEFQDSINQNDKLQPDDVDKKISDSVGEGKMKNDLLKFTNQKTSNKSTNEFFLPPIEIEDSSLLLYDVFLILNLSVSISFWAVHRMSFSYILSAFSEGSLLSLLWIASGLFYGIFLFSAADGHNYNSMNKLEQGKAAGLLALNSFVTTSSLRIIIALVVAFVEHRPVGIGSGEDLIPLEIGFGLILMSAWRTVHSAATRI